MAVDRTSSAGGAPPTEAPAAPGAPEAAGAGAREVLRVRLLTPEGTLFDGEAVSVEAVAEGGSLEVLPDHGALMTPLEIAALTIDAGGAAHSFAVHGGFMDVKGDAVRILAEGAEAADVIDPERAREAADRARRRLAGELAEGTLDRDRARRSLRRAEARIRVAERGQPGRP